MIGASRQAIVLLVAAAAIANPGRAGAQASDTNGPAEPATFLVAAVCASVGAVAGFAVAATVARSPDRLCPAVPGARCDDDGPNLPLLAGSTLLGAGAGAYLGARMLGGRQNLIRSTLGAGVGLLLGGALAAALDSDSDRAIAVSFVVPTGIFAALVGR